MIEDKYKYNSVDMAKYIVAYANEHNFGINMTKMQKLLYIAYGTFLSVKNYRLVNEHPQAWPYGPVFPTTRNKLLKVDMSSITSEDVGDIKDDAEVRQLVKIVFDSFGSRTGADLSAWSHMGFDSQHRRIQMGQPNPRRLHSRIFQLNTCKEWGITTAMTLRGLDSILTTAALDRVSRRATLTRCRWKTRKGKGMVRTQDSENILPIGLWLLYLYGFSS